jgi:beta-1,4-mannosyltransferase
MKNHSPVKVMLSVPAASLSSNPYTALLAQSVDLPGVELSLFSWRHALLRRVDVMHVQWPEAIVRHPNRFRNALRSAAGLAFLAKKRLSGTTLLWTVHNLHPHESRGWLEKLFLRWFYRSVDHRIYINNSAENVEGPSTTILHGSYKSWYGDAPTRSEAKSGVLFFGFVRPYKGLESLLAAIEESADSTMRLKIVGRPTSAEYGDSIVARAEALKQVQLDFRRLSDAELAAEVRAAEVVVLPYRQMYNSGALLMALSLGTHVLAPETPANSSLQDEFGEDWLTLFRGQLSSTDLENAFTLARRHLPGDSVDMAHREWPDIGRRHVDLYRALRGSEGASQPR